MGNNYSIGFPYDNNGDKFEGHAKFQLELSIFLFNLDIIYMPR